MGVLSQGIGSVKLNKLVRGRWSFGGDKVTCSESLQHLGRLKGFWWLLPLENVGHVFRYQDKLLKRFCFLSCPDSLINSSLHTGWDVLQAAAALRG